MRDRAVAGADKRAKLLSDLLAAKGAAAGDAGRPAQPERAAVIPIAKHRTGDDRPVEAPAPPGVLYSKGAATASSFRPSYWSFDHDEPAEPKSAPVKVQPAPAPVPAPVARVAPKSKPLPINFVVAFGCVALCLSTTLFVLSQRHRGEPPIAMAAEPASVPAAPVVAPPPAPPAEPAPAPAPVAPAPAPPPAALAAAATPVVSALPPVASDPPAPVATPPVVEPPTQPAPAAASTAPPAPVPAPASALPAPPAVDTQQAEALLARGDDMLVTGDVAAARLFYQRAAELGSAAAATAVGQTYDPGVLELLRVRGARGDAQMAAEWYRKAIAAGDRQAEIRLKRLLARAPG
jgi:hypothetical protein